MSETTTSPTSSIQISASEIEEIRRLITENNLPSTAGVRVGVKGGGCSGFSYSLNFDVNQAEGDVVVEVNGVRLFCDPKSMLYLNGTTLDYTSGLQGRGFQFQNPNATSTCGCGESFSV
ncbi:MAG: iron-sulfur cluster assembly accessory protein [Planctomycetes bacterium]|nr:iron-sulfur cluster assembly accessory protein [Planctomycetota bacterium]